MTGENAEFQGQFREIRLKIQIEVKMEEKEHDIPKRNFHNFRGKTSLHHI